MATITVTSDSNYSALGAANNDIISLTQSARITIDESTDDIRRWDCITDGEFFCENLTNTPRFIRVGSTGTSLPRIRLEAGGRMKLRGKLISIGTSNGNANQTFTLPTDGGSQYQSLGGVFLDLPTPDTLRDGTPIHRLAVRVDNLADSFGHEIFGCTFEHDLANNRIVFGDGTGGWIPPSGTEIFVPSIQIQVANSTTTVPYFDLALSGRMDFECVSIGSAGSAAGQSFNCDFDNGAGQIWKQVVVETGGQNSPINFNVNAGKVTLHDVILSSARELIMSSATVPPEVKNLAIINRYTGSTDYGIECFNNTGGYFEKVLAMMPNMSNGNTGRGTIGLSSQNVDFFDLYLAGYNTAMYFAGGAGECTVDGLHTCARGSRAQTQSSAKTSCFRASNASNISISHLRSGMTVTEGYAAHRECIAYVTSGSQGVTVSDVIYNANGEMDHITNNQGSGTRLGNFLIEGQLLNRVAELSTTSRNLEMTNVKFDQTQSNGTSCEFGFGSVYQNTMVKGSLTTAVGTGTDCTSNHIFLNEDETVGRVEFRMSPELDEDYLEKTVETGKIVFNQNNRLYIENVGDQVVLTGRIHGGITNFTGSLSKTGVTTSAFDVEGSMRRPGGAWTAWGAPSTMSSQLAGLPAGELLQVRVRITKITAGLSQYLYTSYANTAVTAGYSFPFIARPVAITLNGLPDGIEVRIRRGRQTVAYEPSVSGGSFVYEYDFANRIPVKITIGGAGWVRQELPIFLEATDQTIPLVFEPDPSYAN